MRKKELLNTNDQLFKRNEELLSTVEDLKKEIESLNGEIRKLSAENDRLNAKINATKPLKTLEEKITARAAVSKETEYGASVIGKIVVSAAKYCNLLTSSPESDITKEQVNLILGRTEVAKSEILKEISKENSLEDKKIAIDALQKSAEDYFSSIMAQTQ